MFPSWPSLRMSPGIAWPLAALSSACSNLEGPQPPGAEGWRWEGKIRSQPAREVQGGAGVSILCASLLEFPSSQGGCPFSAFPSSVTFALVGWVAFGDTSALRAELGVAEGQ